MSISVTSEVDVFHSGDWPYDEQKGTTNSEDLAFLPGKISSITVGEEVRGKPRKVVETQSTDISIRPLMQKMLPPARGA